MCLRAVFFCFRQKQCDTNYRKSFQDKCCAIIMFDLMSPSTYERIPHWYDYLTKTIGPGNIPIVVCGNRPEWKGGPKIQETQMEYFQKMGFQYFDICTKCNNRLDVERPFFWLARKLCGEDGNNNLRFPSSNFNVRRLYDLCWKTLMASKLSRKEDIIDLIIAAYSYNEDAKLEACMNSIVDNGMLADIDFFFRIGELGKKYPQLWNQLSEHLFKQPGDNYE